MNYNIVISLEKRQFCFHVLSCSIQWHHHVLGLRSQPYISSLQSVVGCDGDAMLLPIDISFVHYVQLRVHADLVCFKHSQSDSNSGSWLAMDEQWRLHFEGRWSHDTASFCHPKAKVLQQVGGCRNGEQQLALRHLCYTSYGDQVQLAFMRDTPRYH